MKVMSGNRLYLWFFYTVTLVYTTMQGIKPICMGPCLSLKLVSKHNSTTLQCFLIRTPYYPVAWHTLDWSVFLLLSFCYEFKDSWYLLYPSPPPYTINLLPHPYFWEFWRRDTLFSSFKSNPVPFCFLKFFCSPTYAHVPLLQSFLYQLYALSV